MQLVGTTTEVACWLCGRPSIVYGSYGLADMGLCADDLAQAETQWRMHAGADGMYAWADTDGAWHGARQFFTSVHVMILREEPRAFDLLAQRPGGASVAIGLLLPLPCTVCGSPAAAATELDSDGYSAAVCSRHLPELERRGARVVAAYDDGVWRPAAPAD